MITLSSILPAEINYELWQGDTWEPGTITARENGVPINLTGYTAKMEIRHSVSNDVVLTLQTGSGITMTSLGVINITMTAAQTAQLVGQYLYDLQITDTSSRIRTYTHGLITVMFDTTNN